ncbi:MAG: hypothetical protein KME08_18175 [Aphanothece sp. CMT-3BRIN-NPC111]|jgi:hypothetical protein|nr:hypothetical protein [Aphanothece sp. CMT-3BRIN-NPC111]
MIDASILDLKFWILDSKKFWVHAPPLGATGMLPQRAKLLYASATAIPERRRYKLYAYTYGFIL